MEIFDNRKLYKGVKKDRYEELLKIMKEHHKPRPSPPFCFIHSIATTLPKLRKYVQTDKRFIRLSNLYIEVKVGDIAMGVTGTQLYRKIFEDIDIKYSMLNEALHGFLLYKSEVYDRIEKSNRRTSLGQKVVKFNTEYWHTVNHIELVIHLFRSIMDLIAQLTPVFYLEGNQPPNNSFKDQFEWFSKRTIDKDKVFYQFLSNNLTWFKEIKSIRDSIAHYASIDMGFKVFDADYPELIICVNRFHTFDEEIRIEHQMRRCFDGLNNFMDFYDNHFLKT